LYKGWRMNTQVHPYEKQRKSCRDNTCVVRKLRKYTIFITKNIQDITINVKLIWG